VLFSERDEVGGVARFVRKVVPPLLLDGYRALRRRRRRRVVGV
jgi:hypothetical protein